MHMNTSSPIETGQQSVSASTISKPLPNVSLPSCQIRTGVYLLRNIRSGTALDINHGAWNDSKIQGWKTGPANADPNDLVNRRFIICSNSVYPETVNLLSLAAGAYVAYIPSKSSYLSLFSQDDGLMNSGRGDRATVVRGRATCAQNTECLWIPEAVPGSPDGKSIFRFRAFNDPNRLLDLVEGGANNGTPVRAWPATEPSGGTSQHWILEQTEMDAGKTADWMSQISPQSTPFSMMSIPGTHQSLALKSLLVSDNPRCQNRSPYLQLCDGIRYLDLRLDLYSYESKTTSGRSISHSKPYLIARHGTRPVFKAWEGYSLSAVLQSIKYFLERHPGETIFVSARIESSASGDSQNWVRTLYEEVEAYRSSFFYIADLRTFAELSLDDVRGKALLLCDSIRGANQFIDDAGHYKTPINNVQLFFRSFGSVQQTTTVAPAGAIKRSNWENHARYSLSENIAAAGRQVDSSLVFRTGLNSSGLPWLSGTAWGSFYNPIDFFNWLNQNWFRQELDDQVHPKGVRMGLVTFDFYELALDFVKFIIERNDGVYL